MKPKQYISVALKVPEGDTCSPIDCVQCCYGKCYIFEAYLNKRDGAVYEKCDACRSAKVVSAQDADVKEQMTLFDGAL